MRKSRASYGPRTRKKRSVAVDLTDVEFNEPLNELFPQPPDKKNDKNEEREEDPEEDPEEISNDEFEEDPQEDPEEQPEEIPNEEFEEDPEEYLSEEVNDESEEEPEEDSETLVEVRIDSNEKKRSLESTVDESSPSQKKLRQMESSGASEAAVADEKSSEKGSSGKRRRSRWDLGPGLEPEPTQDGENGEADGGHKRRKTRWSSDDSSQLKILGPIHLPDFKTEIVVDPDLVLKIEKLKAELVDINNKLVRSELHDDRPEEERSPSPPPIYNSFGFRTNTREERLRSKLINKRQTIISQLINGNPTFEPPKEYVPSKLSKKIYIPVKEYPGYNFAGLILGPRGNTVKRMEKESGARIAIRGSGFSKMDSSDDDAHVLVVAETQESMDSAVAMVEKLLIPEQLGMSDHKRAQLEELARLKGHCCKACGATLNTHHYSCPHYQSTFEIPSDPQPIQKPVKPVKEIASDSKLFVGSLPETADKYQLSELFSAFGVVEDVYVSTDRNTGVSKWGFVTLENPLDAALAVNRMNGYKWDGKVLIVKVAKTPGPPAPWPGPSATVSSMLVAASPNPPAWPGPPATVSSIPTAWPGPVPIVSPNPTAWPGPPATVSSISTTVPPNPPAWHSPPAAVSLIPVTVSPVATAWPGPPGSMLQGPQHAGLGFHSPMGYVYPGTLAPHGVSPSFSPFHDGPPQVTGFKSGPTNFGKQMSFSSPSELAQFAGDPDHPGSEFKSYFATPTLKQALPQRVSHSPESNGKNVMWQTSLAYVYKL